MPANEAVKHIIETKDLPSTGVMDEANRCIQKKLLPKMISSRVKVVN